MEVPVRKLSFWDTTGHYRIIEGCPVTHIAKLRILYPKLLEIIGERDFYQAYEEARVINLCNQILELLNINPSWVDPQTLAALLHSYIDEQGEPHAGKIQELYFRSTEKRVPHDSDTPVEWDEYFAALVTSLITTEGSIAKAYQVLDSVPGDDLERVLVSYSERLQKQYSDASGSPSASQLQKAKRDYEIKMQRLQERRKQNS